MFYEIQTKQTNPVFKSFCKILIKVFPFLFFTSNFQLIPLILNWFSLTFYRHNRPCLCSATVKAPGNLECVLFVQLSHVPEITKGKI